MATQEATLQFVKDKETKGTWRYAEVVPKGQDALIGSVYLRFSSPAWDKLGSPNEIVVTVSNPNGASKKSK